MTRKLDEIELFRVCRESAATREPDAVSQTFLSSVTLELFDRIGMHPKRGRAIMRKWTDKGWWDYGMTLFGGWFTDQAPEQLER